MTPRKLATRLYKRLKDHMVASSWDTDRWSLKVKVAVSCCQKERQLLIRHKFLTCFERPYHEKDVKCSFVRHTKILPVHTPQSIAVHKQQETPPTMSIHSWCAHNEATCYANQLKKGCQVKRGTTETWAWNARGRLMNHIYPFTLLSGAL